jgi:short-subunit dehydrogenase
MKFKDKTVWITGASSGIGEALAYELSRTGARLILSARNQQELQRVLSGCDCAEKHLIIPLDLENYHQLEDLANRIWEEHGPIDVLINNAGLSQHYLVADSKFESDEKIININLLGTIALTRPVLKRMLERNQGQIAVTLSMLGFYGMQTRCAYSASKHGLKGYFEGLRNELFKSNIKITLIYPGYIKTQIAKHALIADGRAAGQNDKFHKQGIAVARCAEKIIYAIEHEKPEQIVAGMKERFGLLLVRYFPGLFRLLSPKFDI